jgi:phosphate transport system substrate-binding protein
MCGVLSKSHLAGNMNYRGSSSRADLGQRLGGTFHKFHSEVGFWGSTLGSEAAIQSLAENPELVIGVSRPVDESDLKILQAVKCKEPVAVVLATEVLAIYVNEKNPIASLSKDSFVQLFAASPVGKANVRGDFGVTGDLTGKEIARFERGNDSGTQTFLVRTLLGNATPAPSFKVCLTDAEVCSEVGKNTYGVGIGDLYSGIPGIRRVPLVVDNRVVDATEENVLSGSYSLVRPFVMIFDKSQCAVDGGLREEIIRFVLSRDGQATVLKSGLFPVDPAFATHQITEVFGQKVC